MKHNLSFRELQYFVAIIDSRHFGRAAESLHVTQPTLSMQFRKLEEKLGGTLVERGPRDVILTPLGAMVLPLARQILSIANSIEVQADEQKKDVRFRIGAIPTISPYLVPIISRDLGAMPQISGVSLHEGQTAELVKLLKEGSIDVAIVSTPLGEKGVKEIDVFTEPFFLAVVKSHPLAKRSSISFKEVRRERFLLLSEGHCMRKQALSICKILPSQIDRELTGSSIETLRSMVGLGNGVTLIPKCAVRGGGNVAYLPLQDVAASRKVGLIYRATYSRTDLVEMLVQIIKKVADK